MQSPVLNDLTGLLRDTVSFSGLTPPTKDRKPVLTPRYQEALVYATRLHENQTRKGSDIPYISHLMAVASIALEHGANEDEAIAALLHDAVEDQGGAPTLAEIRRRFGDGVAEIVAGCTDADVTPKPPWRARKEAYIAHIATAGDSVLLVSASDKLHNVRSILSDYHEIGDAVWSRFKGGKEGTLWYYRSLVEAFKKRKNTPLIRELERSVAYLEKLTTSPTEPHPSA
jgi:(p)ppGpp synthase/HD superfamily hydrolase